MIRSFLNYPIALLLAVLLAGGCSPPEKPGSRKKRLSVNKIDPFNPAEERQVLQMPAPADREKLNAFGQAFAAALQNGDDAVVKAAWDLEELLRISIGENEEAALAFFDEARLSFKIAVESKPGGIMWAGFKQPWRFLRGHEVDGEPRLLCRTVTDGRILYVDLIPRMNADGQPKIVDAYHYHSGARLSEADRGVFFHYHLVKAAGKPAGELLETPDSLITNFEELQSLNGHLQDEEFQAFLDGFQLLPAEVQKEKTVLLNYVSAAGNQMARGGSRQVYENGVKRYRELHGDDPALVLRSLDYYFFLEDYAGAREAIGRLDEAVGGDPFLDYFRANVLMAEERFDEALRAAESARDNDPDFEEPYWGIVNIQLARGDFGAVAEALEPLVTRFKYEFDLEADPAYEAFRLSPEGKAWIEKHQADTVRP